MGGDEHVHPASTPAPARIRGSRRYRRDVLSLITDRYETTRQGPAGCAANLPPAISGVRILVLVRDARHRPAGVAAPGADRSPQHRHPGLPGGLRARLDRLAAGRLPIPAAGHRARGDGGGGRHAGRAVPVQHRHRGRLRGHLVGGRPAEHRGVAHHHRRDRRGLPDRGLHGRGTGRNAGGLPGGAHRPVGVRPHPPRLPAAGRGGRGGPRAGPAGARGREPGGGAGRAGADRPRDPRRARPLPRGRVGEPAGGRGAARRTACRLAPVRRW